MIWAIAIAVALYAFIGFFWGSFLNALTAPSGDVIGWQAVLHGVFWPISMLFLIR
jgi:hypothetical protein